MEQHDAGLVSRNEGDGSTEETTVSTRFGSGLHDTEVAYMEPVSNEYGDKQTPFLAPTDLRPEIQESVPERPEKSAVITPTGIEELPPELRPDPDGKPPEVTPELIRKLRGKYFTVRHVPLPCGHKMDMTNEPRTNCETCWYQWFNVHGPLVETTHEFYQEKGKGPLIAMRGARYTKMWLRFMSTVAHLLQEQKAAEEARLKELENGSENSSVGKLGDGYTEEDSEGGTTARTDEGREG